MKTEMTGREMGAAMAAFAALGGLLNSAEAQNDSTADMSKSRVYKFSEMPVKNNANGGWSRAVLHGTLPTGEYIESHQSMLPPGQMPHLPHKHRNTEFLLIREGRLEYLNDGKPESVGPGDVVFTASNVMHGLKNVGTTNATYFVVSISKAQL